MSITLYINPMKLGDSKKLDYQKGLRYKSSAPDSLMLISSKGLIKIKSDTEKVIRVYVNIINSFGAVLTTVPIDVLPLNENPNSYISVYIG